MCDKCRKNKGAIRRFKKLDSDMDFNPTQDPMFRSVMGLFFSSVGKSFLESAGHTVDFKINGEPIDDIKNLAIPTIEEKLRLAIKEERYEDAAKLKKIIDGLKTEILPINTEGA